MFGWKFWLKNLLWFDVFIINVYEVGLHMSVLLLKEQKVILKSEFNQPIVNTSFRWIKVKLKSQCWLLDSRSIRTTPTWSWPSTLRSPTFPKPKFFSTKKIFDFSRNHISWGFIYPERSKKTTKPPANTMQNHPGICFEEIF